MAECDVTRLPKALKLPKQAARLRDRLGEKFRKSEIKNLDVWVLTDEDVVLPLSDLDDLAAGRGLDAEAIDLVLAEVAD